jgi:MFS family permease
MRRHMLVYLLLFYVILLTLGLASDLAVPAIHKTGTVVSFYCYRSIAFTLANLALLFAAICLVIAWASLSRRHGRSMAKPLLVRRVLSGAVAFLLCAAASLGSVYVATKRIVVDDEKIQYHSLFETKAVRWSRVRRVDANFVPTSRLGLAGASSYAWVEFHTIDGETVRFSLRFVRASRELERLIQEKTASRDQAFDGGLVPRQALRMRIQARAARSLA